MPYPEPQSGESEEEGQQTCMDDETMVKDYPDPRRRLGMCQIILEEAEEEDWARVLGRSHVTRAEDIQDKKENVKKEYRSISKIRELRASSRKIEGFIPYNEKSDDLGGFKEIIRPTAFQNTLKRKDRVMSLWQHKQDQPLANSESGTLVLEDTPRGLRISIDVPNTSWGRDAVESVKRGDVKHFSFGFLPEPEGEEWSNGIRALTDVKLIEVSPVTWAAYPATCARIRHINKALSKTVCDFSPIRNYWRVRLEHEDRKARHRLFKGMRGKLLRLEMKERLKQLDAKDTREKCRRLVA